MEFWERLFKKDPPVDEPIIKMGRFSDLYKNEEQYDAWDKSLALFEEERYIDAFLMFLIYLRDPAQENVAVDAEQGRVSFSFLQGSKLITGFLDGKKVRAESRIAKIKAMNIGFLRLLLEHNYGLKYSRYALDDEDHLTLVFDSFLMDASPYKLYYALKELAIHADKQDDLLIHEFTSLEPVNIRHVQPLADAEVKIKYRYYKSTIDQTLNVLNKTKLNLTQYPNSAAMLLMGACYKLDYLISAEGIITETFERISRQYFAEEEKAIFQKINTIRGELETLGQMSFADFSKEIYRTQSTFGITTPAGHQQIADLIQNEWSNLDWYIKNDHVEFAFGICDYIIGYCLFNFALQEPVRDLMHMYFRIIERNYFIELGYADVYWQKDQLNRKEIRKSLLALENRHSDRFGFLKIPADQLIYDHPARFAQSFLGMIKSLDLTKTGL